MGYLAVMRLQLFVRVLAAFGVCTVTSAAFAQSTLPLRQSIDDAEADLGRLLADVNAAPRAEKTTITPVLEAAFDKLRKARINLRDLEKMIDGSD